MGAVGTLCIIAHLSRWQCWQGAYLFVNKLWWKELHTWPLRRSGAAFWVDVCPSSGCIHMHDRKKGEKGELQLSTWQPFSCFVSLFFLVLSILWSRTDRGLENPLFPSFIFNPLPVTLWHTAHVLVYYFISSHQILESMSLISVVSVIHWHCVIVLKLTRAVTGVRSASVGCATEIPGFTAHLACCMSLDICVKSLMSHQSATLSVCCYSCYTFCIHCMSCVFTFFSQ